jgi:hypothetical protein
MKKIIIIVLISFYSSFSYSNSDSTIAKINNRLEFNQVKLDSLIKLSNHIISKCDNSEKTWLEKNGSWLAAIVVALMSIPITLIVNNSVRKSNSEITKMQIESAQKIAMHQVKSSSISSFRQVWINDLRIAIAEYISLASFLRLRIHVRKDKDFEAPEYFKKLVFEQEKVSLLLNPTEEKHKEIISLMVKIRNCLYVDGLTTEEINEQRDYMKQMSALSKEILKEEWTRIKKEISVSNNT